MLSAPTQFLLETLKKPWLASSLFFSLFLANGYYESASFLLTEVDAALPGIASFHQVDVNARIGIFYKVLGLFAVSFTVLSLALSKLETKSDWLHSLLLRLQPVSWFGILFLFASVLQSSQKYVWPIFFASILALVFIGLIEKLTNQTIKSSRLLLGFVLSISLTFGIKAFFHFILFIPLPVQTEYIFTVLFVASTLLLAETRMWVLTLLVSLPILVILSSEVSWISMSNGYSTSAILSFCIVLPLFTIALFSLRNRVFKWSNERFISGRLLPFVLISLGLLSQYAPVAEASKELFELANPSNAVMRSFQFGEWPLVDYLNSHLMSELGFRFLFVALNGYSGNTDFLVYDFLHQLIFMWVAYSFLRRTLGNGYWAFFIILAFPWLTIALPTSFSIVLVSVFLLEQCIRLPDLKRYLLMGLWSVFLVIWKIDLGVSNILALGITLLVTTLFRKGAFQNLKKLLLAATIIGAFVGLIFVLINSFGQVDLVHHLKLAKDYFSAGQAHGFEKLSRETDRLFYLHHLVFPSATTLMVVLAVIGLARKKLKPSFGILSILFLGIFIIANAQRGLVRHGFMEQTDLHLASFTFLLGALAISKLFSGKWLIPAFVASLTVFPALTKVPSTRGHLSLLTELQRAKYTDLSSPWEGKTRFVDSEDFLNKNHGEFKEFMNMNFGNDASFIDMSNTPMWYYYTLRQVPSYFNQYLQNTVTPFLQNSNLERLHDMNLPVAIFSRWPESWWDRTDRVPNTIRYHFITQHIFKNYSPHSIQSGRFVWLEKGQSANAYKGFIPDSSTVHRLLQYDLEYFPSISSKLYGDLTLLKKYAISNKKQMNLGTDFKHDVHQFLQLVASGKRGTPITIHLKTSDDKAVGEFTFKLAGHGSTPYTIPVSSQYNWISLKPDHIEFSGFENSNVKIHELEMVELK